MNLLGRSWCKWKVASQKCPRLSSRLHRESDTSCGEKVQIGYDFKDNDSKKDCPLSLSEDWIVIIHLQKQQLDDQCNWAAGEEDVAIDCMQDSFVPKSQL